jgi:hypothetical protein
MTLTHLHFAFTFHSICPNAKCLPSCGTSQSFFSVDECVKALMIALESFGGGALEM